MWIPRGLCGDEIVEERVWVCWSVLYTQYLKVSCRLCEDLWEVFDISARQAILYPRLPHSRSTNPSSLIANRQNPITSPHPALGKSLPLHPGKPLRCEGLKIPHPIACPRACMTPIQICHVGSQQPPRKPSSQSRNPHSLTTPVLRAEFFTCRKLLFWLLQVYGAD